MESLQDYEYEQREDCAFYYVNGEYGWYYEPIDDHAIYGWLALGERNDEEFDIPHRNYPRSLTTAIRTVEVDDRVRVNDEGWMNVTETTTGGFVAVPENGHVEYEIRARYTPKSLNAETGPRKFKRETWESRGRVYCLEIKWESDDHLRYK